MRSAIALLTDFESKEPMKPNNHLSAKISLATILAGAVLYASQLNAAPSPTPDPASHSGHAAHVASGQMPADSPKGDPAVTQQLSTAQSNAAQLKATLAQNSPQAAASAAPAASAMPGMPGMSSPAASPSQSASMSGGMKSGGMGDDKMMMGKMDMMMQRMDKMMPMMERMMGMSGGSMGGGNMASGSMPTGTPAPGMTGGGMGMMDDDKMEMRGMMGMSAMGNSPAKADSALPGFPGASHLYHVGATGFFLDHPQHISLTTDQQVQLNKIKDQAMTAKSAADRSIEQAEQELASLTAADQPDVAKIEAKVRDIAKMAADQRMAFIRAVGEAAKVLTPDQRKSLTGFAPPVPAMNMPAASASPSPMPMSHM